jgi:hypothetical protein
VDGAAAGDISQRLQGCTVLWRGDLRGQACLGAFAFSLGGLREEGPKGLLEVGLGGREGPGHEGREGNLFGKSQPHEWGTETTNPRSTWATITLPHQGSLPLQLSGQRSTPCCHCRGESEGTKKQ